MALRNLLIPFHILGTILIVRFLHPAEYGKWFFLWNIVSTAAPLLSLGWLETLSKFFPELPNRKDKNRLFTLSFLVTLFASICVSLPYLLGLIYLARYIPVELKQVQISFYLFLMFNSFLNLFDGYYRGIGRFKFWTLLLSLRSLVSIILSLVFIYFISAKFEAVFYGYLGITFLLLGILFWNRKNDFSFQNLLIEKNIFNFLLISYLAQIAFILKANIDPILIRLIIRKSYELAYFEVGAKIPRILEALLLTPMAVPLLYHFSTHNPQLDKKEMVLFGSKIIAFAVASISLALFSFSDWIIPALFTDAYRRSIPILKIYAFVPFLTSMIILGHTYLFASNKPTVPTLLLLAGFIISSVLDLLWIPKFGILGAAFSGLIVNILFVIGNLIYLSRHQIQMERIFYKLLLALSVSAGLNFLIPYCALPIFFFLSYVWKLITLQDIQKVKEIIKEVRFSNK